MRADAQPGGQAILGKGWAGRSSRKGLDIVIPFTKPVERTIVYNLKAESNRKLVGTLKGPDRYGTGDFTAEITLHPRTD